MKASAVSEANISKRREISLFITTQMYKRQHVGAVVSCQHVWSHFYRRSQGQNSLGLSSTIFQNYFLQNDSDLLLFSIITTTSIMTENYSCFAFSNVR